MKNSERVVIALHEFGVFLSKIKLGLEEDLNKLPYSELSDKAKEVMRNRLEGELRLIDFLLERYEELYINVLGVLNEDTGRV